MSAFSEIAALAKEIRAGFPDVVRDLRRDRKNAPAELLERAAGYRKKLERLATLVCDHLPKLTLVEPILRVVVRKSGPELEFLSDDDLERLDDDLKRIVDAAQKNDAISPVERVRDRIQLVVALAFQAERTGNALRVDYEAAVALRVAIQSAYGQCPQIVSADVANQIEGELDECEEAAGNGDREATIRALKRLKDRQSWLLKAEKRAPDTSTLKAEAFSESPWDVDLRDLIRILRDKVAEATPDTSRDVLLRLAVGFQIAAGRCLRLAFEHGAFEGAPKLLGVAQHWQREIRTDETLCDDYQRDKDDQRLFLTLQQHGLENTKRDTADISSISVRKRPYLVTVCEHYARQAERILKLVGREVRTGMIAPDELLDATTGAAAPETTTREAANRGAEQQLPPLDYSEPFDARDYVLASVVITKHAPPGVVLNHRRLSRFLELHKENIRTRRPPGRNGKPRKNRLLIHLADWHKNHDALIEWDAADRDPVEDAPQSEIDARHEAVRRKKTRRK